MAFDRYDSRDTRDERSRWSDEHDRRWSGQRQSGRGGDRNQGDDRGFWDRASDEVASWFGDEDAERRRRRDQSREESGHSDRGRFSSRDRDEDRGYGRADDRERSADPGRDRSWNDNRGVFARGGSSERDYNRGWREEFAGPDFDRNRTDGERDRGWTDRYRPITGDYGRGGRSPSDQDRDYGRSQSEWAQDEYRSSSRAGTANWSDRSREDRSDRSGGDRFDPHYHSWRDRHMSELDRDYDDYRAEHQSRFEKDFGSWRERRQQKRGLLGKIRQDMEVVGNDDKPVGKIDKVLGDRVVLAKSDPEGAGARHSLSCSDVDRIEGNRVILDCSAEQARNRWRDENRGRALFERDDQGEMGPRMLDRSFEGTYR